MWKNIFKGIEKGREAFCGPHTVQIDLTDKCNNNCIACWVHSPLVERTEKTAKGQRELPFRLVKKLIEDLCKLGAKEIILSGSGEPFLYPKINELIKIIKSKKLYLNIITNATFINKETAKLLVKHKVDFITASIWAGDAKTYILTHPGKKEEHFRQLKSNLETLSFYKEKYKALKPHLKLYNVICSKNYNSITEMIGFSKCVDADSVEFQIVDIVSGKTDSLAVTDEYKKVILKQLEDIRKRKDMVFFNAPKEILLDDFAEKEFLDFGKIWKSNNIDFFVSQYSTSLICKKGHEIKNKRIIVSESTSTKETHPKVFWYKFKNKICNYCDEKEKCLNANGEINVKLINMLGLGSFLRRLSRSDLEKGLYEKQINSIPCYVGWYYSRILTSGDVIPCCKAAKLPLGNLHKEHFLKIWRSSKYEDFRFNAKNFLKDNDYFSKINCIKSCDNWGMNLEIHERLKEFDEKRRISKDRRNKRSVILARDFTSGNFNAGNHNFGNNLIIDGGENTGFSFYEFEIYKDGIYEFWSRYAAKESRPLDIYIDDKILEKKGLGCITGGWTSDFLKWHRESNIRLERGKHTLKISSSQCIPHIEKFAFFKKTGLPIFFDLMGKQERYPYFKAFVCHILKYGAKETFSKIMHNKISNNLNDFYPEVLGIYDGSYGYKGPFYVQLDLTDKCNNNCIACWCNSPLFKGKRVSLESQKQTLPLALVKDFLDDISGMGTKEVYYSGGGEPFMHPQIMEILEYTKKRNLICHVNTNFTLLNKEKLDRLVDMGVDTLTVSVWAATPETYIKTHPGRTAEDFNSIKKNLLYLNAYKKDKPYIKLYNVIFNMNYFEVEKMVSFAQETNSESLELTLVDTVPSVTDSLCLNKEQLAILKKLCTNIKSRLDKNNKIKDNGVLLFQFDSFLRRISVVDDVCEAKYDRNIVDSMPCYIGWLFARVIPNGEVHSCLKAHRIPTGSLYLNSFSEIWNSKKQKYFRKKTLVYKKSDPFFRFIGNDPDTKESGCYKSCDDVGRNLWMHNKIKMLAPSERKALKSTAKALKFAKWLMPKDEHKNGHSNPLIRGIIHGRKAFVGPEQVVIDITNRCNLRCISCWLYSPLLKKDRPKDDWLKKELSKKVLINLINDLVSLGTKRVRFTGGGEPFMHKDLMEVIEYACKKKLLVAITTNFGLVSKKEIKRLVELNLEELCVSIWASNAEIYCKVHPGTSPVYFEKLKENLLYLKKIRKRKPRLTFANVIMNTNVEDFEGMYNFGLQHGADALYFTAADVFPEQTDKLLLNDEERKELIAMALGIKKRGEENRIQLEFFDGFLQRISKSKKDFEKGEFDKYDSNKIPCYAGWIFSRVLADGNIAPCCRGVRKTMGNINEKSFKNIWFSTEYNEFRAKAKYLSKSNNYFKDVECGRECDNLMHNEQMHKTLLGLTNK